MRWQDGLNTATAPADYDPDKAYTFRITFHDPAIRTSRRARSRRTRPVRILDAILPLWHTLELIRRAPP